MTCIKTTVLCILLSLPAVLFAQNIKLISATQQSWSGGIAGHSGCRYVFTIECDSTMPVIIPDTVWVGRQPTPLVYKSTKHPDANAIRTRKKNRVRYELRAETNNNQYPYRDQEQDPYETRKTTIVKPPVKYKGLALIAYKYNGKRGYFGINKLTKSLPPISYP